MVRAAASRAARICSRRSSLFCGAERSEAAGEDPPELVLEDAAADAGRLGAALEGGTGGGAGAFGIDNERRDALVEAAADDRTDDRTDEGESVPAIDGAALRDTRDLDGEPVPSSMPSRSSRSAST